MGEAVLEARGLRKSFKSVEAVRGVDVVVQRGERVGLLGPNGAGKTTTLLMLLGAITPMPARSRSTASNCPASGRRR